MQGDRTDRCDQSGVEAVVHASTVPMLLLDARSCEVVVANAAFRDAITGHDRRIDGRKLVDLVQDGCAAGLAQAIGSALADGHATASVGFPVRTRGIPAALAELAIHALPGSPRRLLCEVLRGQSPVPDARATHVLEQLRAAVETLPDGFVLYDREDRLVLCNSKYREFYAESAPAMVPGARFEDILRFGLERGQYAAAVGREDAWLSERMRAHRAAREPVEQQLAGGRWLRILERNTPDGGRVGLRIDITSQVRSRRRAERAEQRLRDAIEALPAGFWLFDADDRLIMFNERYRQMYESSAGVLVPGVTFEDVLRYGLERGQYPEAEGREQAWLADVMRNRSQKEYELEYQLDNGRWIRSSSSPTSEGGFVGFRVDITELKNKQAELEETAESDALTGLLNRRGLTRHLEFLEATISSGARIAALHVDLDKFKAVNDAIGHDAGDFVLEKVAERMRRNGTPGEIVARIGGDEFLMVGPGEMDDAALVKRAETLRRDLTRPIVFQGRICQVGATVGIGTWTQGNGPSERVVSDADIALNAGKRAGRNCTRLFTDDMRRASVEQAVIAQEIREALEDGQIVSWFQPQFSIDGRTVTGFESLARWIHPARGVISAGVFLPAASEAGLAADIDRVVRQGGLEYQYIVVSSRLIICSLFHLSLSYLTEPT